MTQTLIDTLKADLRTLRLKDMADGLEAVLQKAQMEKQGHLTFLAELLQNQLKGAQNRALERRLAIAGFPPNMTFANFDWNFQPSLPVEHLKDLATLGFVSRTHPLLILGKTGTGKTHIATALGVEACCSGFKVKFYKLQKLLALLYATLADDTTEETIFRLTGFDLLIIDHIGFIRGKPEYPSLLLDLVSACQDRVAIIVTSSISLEEWTMALGNPAITNDIVDRLFHHAAVINIRPGRSYRSEGPHAPALPATE